MTDVKAEPHSPECDNDSNHSRSYAGTYYFSEDFRDHYNREQDFHESQFHCQMKHIEQDECKVSNTVTKLFEKVKEVMRGKRQDSREIYDLKRSNDKMKKKLKTQRLKIKSFENKLRKIDMALKSDPADSTDHADNSGNSDSN